MSTASVKTVLPLSLLTGVSVLAMDFYLPAVPNLQASFGIDVTLAQATITLFLAGLAASQLLWAELMTRIGPRRSVQIGIWLLVATNVACALATTIHVLLVMRLIQGFAAGAAMVVAPSVVRATLPDEHAVRGIAMISMVEAIIPAAGPVLGAALLGYADWRGTFWVLGALTLLALPLVLRVTPRELPGLDRTVDATYAAVLGKPKFRRLAVSHALSFGALITFVASAPQLMANALGLGASAFPALQVLGVASFIVVASQAGRISKRLGVAAAIQLGACLQAALCAAMLALSFFISLPFAGIAVFWCAFCGGLAVRGPATFTEVLALPPAQMGRASGLLTLAVLVVGACGTQLAAPYMGGSSVAPLLTVMLAACLLSLAAVLPYPHMRDQAATVAP